MPAAPPPGVGGGSVRSALKAALGGVGLLALARRARDALVAVGWLRHNRRFLRGSGGDGLPVPSARLRILTTASPSVEWFVESGREAANSIREQLERHRVPIAEIGQLLDFGCGCGRVVRHWANCPAMVHGCDYNADLVNWCRRRLPFARFETNGLAPPLPYAAASFDLVYALSVFTHLPPPLQQQWIAEIARVLRPGGYLIVSTHGEAYLDTLDEVERRDFRAGRLVVRHHHEAGSNRCGVFFSEDYVRRAFGPRFVVCDYAPRGARGNPPQDLVLLQAALHGRVDSAPPHTETLPSR